MTRRLPRGLKTASLALVGVLLALVVGELGARLLAPFEIDPQGRLVFALSEEIQASGPEETDRVDGVMVWKRAHPDRPAPRPGFEGFRILVLGDSVLEPAGLPQADGAAMRLEARLNRDLVGGPYEVVNLSEGGWSTLQEEAALRREGLSLEPDLVLVGVVPNDTQQYVLRDGAIILAEFLDLEARRGPAWARTLFRRSYLLTLVWFTLQVHDLKATPSDAVLRRASETRVFEPLLRMREEVRSRGGRFALLCLAGIPEGPPPLRNGEPHFGCGVGDLEGWAATVGIPLLNPMPTLVAAPIEETRLGHIHLKPEGHRILADRVFEWLVSEGLVPYEAVLDRTGISSGGTL